MSEILQEGSVFFNAKDTNLLTYTQAEISCVGDKKKEKKTGCVVQGQEEEQELKEFCASTRGIDSLQIRTQEQ